jgi:hypothetical protein
MGGRWGLLGAEGGAVIGRGLCETEGGQQRREQRRDQHEQAQDDPGDEHAALQADAAAQVADHRQAQVPGRTGLLGGRCCLGRKGRPAGIGSRRSRIRDGHVSTSLEGR